MVILSVGFFLTSLLMTGVILAMVCLHRFLSRRCAAKWRCAAWIIILIGLLIPFRPLVEHAPAQVQISDAQGFIIGSANQPDRLQEHAQQTEDTGKSQVDWEFAASAVCCVWMVGGLISASIYITQHRMFRRQTKRWRTQITDQNTLQAFESAKQELGLQDHSIALEQCSIATGPMLCGLLHPVILLPDRTISKEKLALMLKHELYHYKHKDLWRKALLIAVQVLHWFNPAVHWMARCMQKDCEAFCDEAVLHGAGPETRKLYGETILDAIGQKHPVITAFSTNFYGGKKQMKQRLQSILEHRKKNTLLAAVCIAVILAVTLISGTAIAFGAPEAENETEPASVTGSEPTLKQEVITDPAEPIANADVEITTTRTTDTASPDSGSNYDSEPHSIVTYPGSDWGPVFPDDAVQTALRRTDGGDVSLFELKGSIYQVTIVKGETTYYIEISTKSGAILTVEQTPFQK